MSVLPDKLAHIGADRGRTYRLGLMGGTFDPIHMGHLSCAERARDQLGFDGVLFIPAGNPVFKRSQKVSSAAHRLAMCQLACETNEYFGVSDIEIERGGDTYTVDTLRALHEALPGNVELYLILGDDVLRTLHQWYQAAEVARLAHVVLVGRPGNEAGTDDALHDVRELGFSVHRVETSALTISSSALRAWAGQGKSLRYLAPRRVVEYIAEHGLYSEGN